MKLATLALVTTLGLGGAAHADPKPDGPAPRTRIGQLLLERFDRDHDGRLAPEERRRAIRALRRLAWRLEAEGWRSGLVKRFDADRDGRVGPGEMPPEVGRRLRWLDRDRDGWLDERDPR